MTKIGFVGVGKWAQQLEEAFSNVSPLPIPLQDRAHSRSNDVKKFDSNTTDIAWKSISKFGKQFPSYTELASNVDLVVAAAPPAVTTKVAFYCATNCIPCVATKPLQAHPLLHAAPLFVDFWRFWSRAYQAMKTQIGSRITTLEIDFHGPGPYRDTIDGLSDYGPHAFAIALDLLGVQFSDVVRAHPNFTAIKTGSSIRNPSDVRGANYQLEGKISDTLIRITTGNGSSPGHGSRKVRIVDWEYEHTLVEYDGMFEYRRVGGNGTAIIRSSRQEALNSFARTVLDETAKNTNGHFIENKTVDYSRRADDLILRTRELAALTDLSRN